MFIGYIFLACVFRKMVTFGIIQVIPALGKMKQNLQFRANLGFMMSFSLKRGRDRVEGRKGIREEKMGGGEERRGGTGSPSFIRVGVQGVTAS